HATPPAATKRAASAEHANVDGLGVSKTAGRRHGSTPADIPRLKQLGATGGLRVDAAVQADLLRSALLRRLDVAVFLSTSGDVLNNAQQRAFERWIRQGGGFVGVHAAADTEYDWPFYGNLVGAYFKQHPEVQEATVKVADRVHPSSRHLPKRWVRTDEW